MSYYDLSDGQFLIEGGSLASHAIQQQFNQQFQDISSSKEEQPEVFSSYKYKDVINNAFKQYTALGNLMVKKDAAITFSAIGAIGLALLCINSFVVKIIFLAVATILSFDVELQIPCASILLALFVFRDSSRCISKALVLILSIVVIIYGYWADSLANYCDVIWWMNIFLVVLWGWLILMSKDHSYYSRIIEFGGGNTDESPYDSITDFDNMN